MCALKETLLDRVFEAPRHFPSTIHTYTEGGGILTSYECTYPHSREFVLAVISGIKSYGRVGSHGNLLQTLACIK